MMGLNPTSGTFTRLRVSVLGLCFHLLWWNAFALLPSVDCGSHPSVLTTFHTEQEDSFFPFALAEGDALPKCDPDGIVHPNKYDPLPCWLWNLKVQVPDQKIKKGLFRIEVKGMTCTNFEIGSIDSSYIASNETVRNNNPDPLIALSISGISAVCLGEYKSTGMHGTVQATVQSRDNSPLELDMSFVSGLYDERIRLATSVNVTSCVAKLKVPKHNGLKFSGSISSKFINLFSKPIASYVSSALNKQLCPTIQKQLNPVLTQLIQKADDYMTGLIPKMEDGIPGRVETSYRHMQTTTVSNITSTDLVDFTKDASLLNVGLELLNNILDLYLDKGILLHLLGEYGGGKNTSNSDQDCSDCGFFFRGWNGLISSLTSGSGAVGFNIPKRLRNITFVVPKYGTASIIIKNIHASGLNTLADIDLLRPSGSQSFVSSVASTTGFNLSAGVDIVVKPIPGGVIQGDTLRESFHMFVNSSAVHVLGGVFLGIEREQFENLTVGNVISAIEDVIQGKYSRLVCLLEPLKTISFSQLVANLHILGVSFVPDTKAAMMGSSAMINSLEVDIDVMLNNFLKLFLGEYSLLVTETLVGLTSGPALNLVNKEISNLLAQIPEREEQGCGNETESSSTAPDYIDFRKWHFLGKMNRFLNSTNALRATNRYISCIESYFNKELSASIGLDIGDIGLSIKDIRFENFGTVDKLEFLEPEKDGFHLYNSFGMARCDRHDGFACTVPHISFAMDMSCPKLNVSGRTSVAASFGDFTSSGGGTIQFDVDKFRSLALSQVLSRSQCMAVPASLLDVYGVAGSLGILNLAVNASLVGTSFEPVDIEFQVGQNESLAAIASSVIMWSSASVEDILNSLLRIVLPKAPNLCEGKNPAPDPIDKNEESNSNDIEHWNIIFLFVAFAIAQVSIVLVHRWEGPDDDTTHELSTPLLRLNDQNPSQTQSPSNEGGEETYRAKSPNSALMFRAGIPGFVRHILPIIAVGAMLLLLSSNLSVGASVNLKVSLPDSKVMSLPSLFAFSLGNTVRDFFNAGIYALLLLVLVFSGIWPYLKLLLMIFAWSTPEWILTRERRERLLLLLDALGKLSLVDAYVLVLMIVAFRFHLDLEDTVAIDVFVTPGYGFYSFLLATSASLVIGETMLYYHRSIAEGVAASGLKESLCQHKFEVKVEGKRRRMSLIFQLVVVATILLTGVLLAVGATKESFEFRFDGLAGKLLGDERLRSYSIMSLGSSIPQSVENPSSIGIACIQVAYFFYAIIMPFTCLGIMLLLVCYPMTLNTQRTFLAIAEITNAWSAIEVFLISIVAALMEISTFTEFIIGEKCDLINEIISKHFDKLVEGDDTCYSVTSSVGSSAWYLFVGVVLNSFLIPVLLSFVRCAMAERIRCQSENGLLQVDGTQEVTIVDLLCRWKIAFLMFDQSDRVPSPNEDEELDGADSSRFWEEWRNISSWT